MINIPTHLELVNANRNLANKIEQQKISDKISLKTYLENSLESIDSLQQAGSMTKITRLDKLEG